MYANYVEAALLFCMTTSCHSPCMYPPTLHYCRGYLWAGQVIGVGLPVRWGYRWIMRRGTSCYIGLLFHEEAQYLSPLYLARHAC